MASPLRRPLAHRASQLAHVASSKRARSPDPEDVTTALPKRVRSTPTVEDAAEQDKSSRQAARERRIAEREQQKAEFRDKYRRAFPSWTFYFDLEHIEPDRTVISSFETRIQELGGGIEDFFSNQITHLITNQPLPTEQDADKENLPSVKNPVLKSTHFLKSPIRLKAGVPDDTLGGSGFDIVSKALSFGIKAWSTTKLDSVLNRCLDIPDNLLTRNSLTNQITNNSQRSLTRLLQSERIHGTTERDPTQKRHDFRYFSKSSYFVLVEDLRQELATIAAHEYEIPKNRDASVKTPWPILHCHPCARGPFIPFDDKEKRRWEKQQQAEREKKVEQEENRDKILRMQAMRRKTEIQVHTKKTCDLRRSASLGNLHRRTSYPLPGPQETCLPDGELLESNNASGYLASGAGMTYVAASGNSVSVASTTGTTSAASYTLRNAQLPSVLSGRIRQQVLTSRRASMTTERSLNGAKDGSMGPPKRVPDRQPILRKCKSTNTLRLPRREEGSKPGYCESCRIKFDEFRAHVASRKHQKFAIDDANFLQLDYILARVQRRTVQQMEKERELRCKRRQHCCKQGEINNQESTITIS
ncbi:hypothetical protein AX17_005764 [Amanita inopinata Kibby_2008]|nr:hypothetical protein AX17_005764 [Amanita inopinata Kibby_2008]